MRYTPVELRHIRLTRTTFGGYKRVEADRLIEDVADSFEAVWSERGELADKLEDLEKTIDEIKQREQLLTATLVAAERTAAEAIEAAKREAEIIIAEAHQESRSITRSAQSERERLFVDVRRVETLMRAALGLVEEARIDLPVAAGEPDAAQPWPNREDTREFKAVAPAPDPAPLPELLDEGDDGPWAGRDFAWG